MRRRDLIALLGGVTLAFPLGTRAQTARRLPLVGYLCLSRREDFAPLTAAFLEGMRAVGYVEGREYEIAYRFADNDPARSPAQARELASLRPDVILAASFPDAAVAKKATSSLPIVAPMLVDPVEDGLVASLARPGGNLTGILVTLPSLRVKQLEIIRELVPTAMAIGVLLNPAFPNEIRARHDIEAAGRAKGVKIIAGEATAPGDIDPAFRTLVAARAQALIVTGDSMFAAQRKQIADLALAARLPTITDSSRLFVEAGILIRYGVDYLGNQRRAAYFVDRILKGAKPSDLPIEFPTQLEMVVNARTAKTLGLTIPSSILLRADQTIE